MVVSTDRQLYGSSMFPEVPGREVRLPPISIRTAIWKASSAQASRRTVYAAHQGVPWWCPCWSVLDSIAKPTCASPSGSRSGSSPQAPSVSSTWRLQRARLLLLADRLEGEEPNDLNREISTGLCASLLAGRLRWNRPPCWSFCRKAHGGGSSEQIRHRAVQPTSGSSRLSGLRPSVRNASRRDFLWNTANGSGVRHRSDHAGPRRLFRVPWASALPAKAKHAIFTVRHNGAGKTTIDTFDHEARPRQVRRQTYRGSTIVGSTSRPVGNHRADRRSLYRNMSQSWP